MGYAIPHIPPVWPLRPLPPYGMAAIVGSSDHPVGILSGEMCGAHPVGYWIGSAIPRRLGSHP